MTEEGWTVLLTGRRLEHLRAGRRVRIELQQGTLTVRQDAGAIELTFIPTEKEPASPAWRAANG